MTKELAEKLIGNSFSFHGYNFHVKGKVLSINENWIELQTKKNTQFINADYILSITKIDDIL